MPRSQKKYTYEYPRPAVTVDVVVVAPGERPRVLLIRRKHPPFAGAWALPGGFIDMGETLDAAARRELYEETGIRAGRLEQLHTFGDPGRDPRGRTISVVYLTFRKKTGQEPRPADDAAEVGWHPLHRPPPLAFDHARILALVRRRLASRDSLHP